jgi:hypothetical protein
LWLLIEGNCLGPFEPSTRGALLTGVSALALMGSIQQAYAVDPVPTWQVWIEGASFQTNGGGLFGPAAWPGFMGTVFNPGMSPNTGGEIAAGFDYHLAYSPYHFVFDIRGGWSRAATQNPSSSSTFHTSSFFGIFSTLIDTNNSGIIKEHESHVVADFMAGRDFGLGRGLAQFQVGIRVADLNAVSQAQLNTATTTKNSFYSSTTVTQSGQTAVGTFKSRFFGAGPRAAFTDSVPLGGQWSAEFAAGMAGLIGSRTLDVAITTSPGGFYSAGYGGNAVIFNADAWAGLSYRFTPNFKIIAGLRTDYYNNALLTYNPVTGGLQTVDRNFWGPFVRLSGQF